MSTLLTLIGISKAYPGVRALESVDFDLRPGEIHALVGENGAGKSTLINVLTGATEPDSGSYLFEDANMLGQSPARIRASGISTVFQEFSLAPDLTILENVFLGREVTRFGLLSKASMSRQVRDVLQDLGFDLDLNAVTGRLPRAKQQMAEILKALFGAPKVLILDEPTASLSEAEVERLFAVLESIRERGVGVIYVSHRMEELLRLADRITVLRDGAKIETIEAEGVTADHLVEVMTGRPVGVLYPDMPRQVGDVALSVENLSTSDGNVTNASLDVRQGEVVGIAGLVGCGKSELGRSLFGLEEIATGVVRINNAPVRSLTVSNMLARGLIYFPADRNEDGLALGRPIYENLSIAALDLVRGLRRVFGDRRTEIEEATRVAEKFKLRPPEVRGVVRQLSGGNRQKVMLARGMTRDAGIYVFDEPTVGIDVGARYDVYLHIQELVAEGNAVLIISSELMELMGLCHRIYVMAAGRIVSEHRRENMQEHELLRSFFPVANGDGQEPSGLAEGKP